MLQLLLLFSLFSSTYVSCQLDLVMLLNSAHQLVVEPVLSHHHRVQRPVDKNLNFLVELLNQEIVIIAAKLGTGPAIVKVLT